ncbi:MBL fold metallo-hydrolase [Kitasatospora atroaurantiaca]|uniref:UDP-MurNAc hydroxylase n=1 Tax=Kitasatospora atroaurantiaca TaxID=285545 RepID=A0A561EUB2_9ACTN|nr:MBL fold metallo-hydrolase [Kitasatospora atroaurantiaca]TWE19200.1 UDP-MurNAc hydroxylase [Kitasatospora atroaurantiaca]
MIPSIRHLGHAGFVVEHAGLRILIDPWFHPAFLEAWFPYPDNRDLLPEVVAGRYDYLYISHTHEDHFDRRLLAQLSRDVTVLVPRYRTKSLSRSLAALGFGQQVLLGHREEHRLGPDSTATMLLDTSHKEDSGLLLDLGGYRFLDLNDCNTPMSELPGDVDLLAAQYSGAMWYPNAYDYPAEMMAAKTAAVRSDLLDTLARKVKLTGARAYLPSAGPACFLDPELDRFNDRDATIFPHWEDVAPVFAAVCPETRVVRTAPGDLVAAPAPPGRWFTDPAGYLADYRERRCADWEAYHEGEPAPVTAEEVEAHFARLQRLNRPLLADYRRDLRLETGGTAWGLTLGGLAAQVELEDEPVDPAYVIRIPPRALRAVLDGRAGWEEALLSMRLSLHRDPDVFDLTMLSLLRYGHQPAQTRQLVRERAGPVETIERDGLRLQRYCPHAGEDLSHAEITGGVVECPRHHWKWDTTTGACVSGGALSLHIEPAERPSA